MQTSNSRSDSASQAGEHESSAQALVQLGRLAGVEVGLARARLAVKQATRETGGAPLEELQQAAEWVGLRATLVRLSVADAMSRARSDCPLIAWSPLESRWLIVQRMGLFRARVSDSLLPGAGLAVTRAELARRLGVPSAAESVDFAVVNSERPADLIAREPVSHPDAPLSGGGAEPAATAAHEHPFPWRRFGSLLAGEIRDIRVFVSFSLLAALLYLSVPLAVDALVSHLAFGSDARPFVQAVVMVSLGLLLCLAVAAVIRGFKHYLAEVIQRRIFVRLVADLGHRLPRVKPESLDGQHGPELVNRFLDVVTLQKASAMLLMDGLDAAFSMLIGMILLGLFHPLLLVLVLVLVGLLWVVLVFMARGAVTTSIVESRAKYAVVHWFEEVSRYPHLFKGPGGYELAWDRADQLARTYLDARRQHFRILIRQVGGILSLEVLATVALLMVGGVLVLRQELTLGQLVASELTVTTIVAALAKLPKQIETWYDAMAAMDKVGHIVDLETEREDGDVPAPMTQPATVQVQGAAFEFQPDRPLFDQLSFQVGAGESAALVGPQGSGASTLLALVFALRPLERGFISINGLDVRNWNLQRLRSQVMLLRGTDLMDGSVAENLRLGRADLGYDEVRLALEKVGLFETVMALPLGMDTPLFSGGLPLSSRQRIRLLVARALVQKPKLLLVDELLDGLDAETFAGLVDCVFAPASGWTLLVSTRDPAVVARCQHVVRLDENCGANSAPANASGTSTS
jgi:ABC-type bacteriocin/lantibiotic exporter with double-glycine peptidase domain